MLTLRHLMSLGFLATLCSTTGFTGELMRIGCKAEFLADTTQTVFPESALSLEQIQCLEMDQNQAELKIQPAAIVERYKIPGNELKAVIEENGVPVEKTYLDSQSTITRTHYHIPNCGNVDGKWRMQLAAISDNGKVANEEFYHIIRGVVQGCNISQGEMGQHRFCKTDDEQFGHTQMTIGANVTSRLFIVIDDVQTIDRGLDTRSQMANFCSKKVEGALLTKLNSCYEGVRAKMAQNLALDAKASTSSKALIVPPINYLNQFFKVDHNKYQFGSCDSFKTSTALK